VIEVVVVVIEVVVAVAVGSDGGGDDLICHIFMFVYPPNKACGS